MISHRHLARCFYAPFKEIIWKFPVNENKIYLTFDDGPYPPVTGPLLELLREREVPAIFFLSGEALFRYRHQVAQLDYSPHQIGSHFFHHLPPWGIHRKTLLKEINLTDQLIYRHFRRTVHFFRPPYGVFHRNLFPILRSTSKKIVLWSVMAYDFKWEAKKVLRHLYKQTRPGDIIVFHDAPKTGRKLLEVIPDFIEHCRAKGWQFGKMG